MVKERDSSSAPSNRCHFQGVGVGNSDLPRHSGFVIRYYLVIVVSKLAIRSRIRQVSLRSTVPYGLSAPFVIHSSESRANVMVSYGFLTPRSYRHPIVMSGSVAKAE